MRNLFVTLLFICLLAISCTKDKPLAVPPEAPVTKTITYTVYADTDYSGSFYDNAKGQLELTIAKVTNKGATTQILWDTVFTWRRLGAYPLFQNKITVVKDFSIFDSKEKIQLSYVRKYDFSGMLSQSAIGEAAPTGNASVKYDVGM